MKVKEVESTAQKGWEGSSDEEDMEKPDQVEVFKQMLELMKPGETVTKGQHHKFILKFTSFKLTSIHLAKCLTFYVHLQNIIT